MSSVQSLRIRVGLTDVGSLFGLDDGRVYFRFDDAYALDPNRPVLSMSFMGETETETRTRLLDPQLPATFGAGNGKLPVFFRNLLPEGMLRKHLLSDAGLLPTDELGLLAYCGTDLPGDVWALAETLEEGALGRLLTQGKDSYEMSSHQLPTPEAVSLSGLQPKVSLVEAPGGRYVMRSKHDSGMHYIGKLPASDYAGLPEVEHVSLLMAQAAGVNVCKADLLPLSTIAGQLPFTLRDDARNFLLVHRFDRDVGTPTGRLHMEDFAQVLELTPESKYDGTYEGLGVALGLISDNPDDLLELLRRIKVNELLGNYDAHAKNYSMLYTPDGLVLSPAYDIVAYAAYLGGRGHALKFSEGQQGVTNLTPAVLRNMANAWEVPESKLSAAVTATVDRAMRLWPDMIRNSAMPVGQQDRLLEHLYQQPSAQAWLRRHKGSQK
jgi:serine/threonine-protein kinase HipA